MPKENGQIRLPDCRPGCQRDGVRPHRTSVLPEDQKTAKILVPGRGCV